MNDAFATNLLKDVKVCFVAAKCSNCPNNELEAEEVEYCIASGFVRIKQKETNRLWITHISNVTLQVESKD